MVKRSGIMRICVLGMVLFAASVVRAEPLNFDGSGNFDFSLTGGGIESTSDVAIFNQKAWTSSANAPTMTQDMDTNFILKTSEPIEFRVLGSSNNGSAKMDFAGFGQKNSKMYHEFRAIDPSTGNISYFGFQEQSTDCTVDLNVGVKADEEDE